MQKMSDIEKILYMGVGRSGLGFEKESKVIAETIKELQQYRAIGLTPQMVKDLIESCKKHEKNALENAHIVDEYSAIGTVEECREAVERMKPKTPTYNGDGYAPDGTFVWDEWLCPNCNSRYEVDFDEYDYCPNCGQKILWEKSNE